MRKRVLLTVAGGVSVICAVSGVLFWFVAGAGASHSPLLQLYCILPILSLPAFTAYFWRRWPALIAAWLLMSAEFLIAWRLQLQDCLHRACTTADSLRAAGSALTGTWDIGLLALAAVCLLLDATADPQRPPSPHGAAPADHPFGK